MTDEQIAADDEVEYVLVPDAQARTRSGNYGHC
jgi:hypothetical protein